MSFLLFQPRLKQINPTVAENPNQEEGDEEEAQTPKILSPAERLLQKDSDGFWILGELPSGNVLRVDLGTALHTYTTQQWSMCISILF
jgi:hypothetical protein